MVQVLFDFGVWCGWMDGWMEGFVVGSLRKEDGGWVDGWVDGYWDGWIDGGGWRRIWDEGKEGRKPKLIYTVCW